MMIVKYSLAKPRIAASYKINVQNVPGKTNMAHRCISWTKIMNIFSVNIGVETLFSGQYKKPF